MVLIIKVLKHIPYKEIIKCLNHDNRPVNDENVFTVTSCTKQILLLVKCETHKSKHLTALFGLEVT